MRWKIILVNGGIVMLLSLLSFFLVRSSLESTVVNAGAQRKEVARALQAASAQLSVDALHLERWIEGRVGTPEVVSVFAAATTSARSEAATARASALRDQALGTPEFSRITPSLVVFTDAEGVGVGRNGSELMRGENLGTAYPDLVTAIRAGRSGAALWVDRARQEQLLVGYAPVRGATGEILGSVVIGVPMNDEVLSRTSELTSGRPLALVTASKTVESIASSGGIGLDSAAKAIAIASKGGVGFEDVGQDIVAAAPLAIAGTQAVLVASIGRSLLPGLNGHLWPLLAIGGLGVLLVVVAGFLLGNYISKPVEEIEEGLLLVINGQHDLRFDLEHDELGGLTSRINALLNTILGVPEDSESPEN